MPIDRYDLSRPDAAFDPEADELLEFPDVSTRHRRKRRRRDGTGIVSPLRCAAA